MPTFVVELFQAWGPAARADLRTLTADTARRLSAASKVVRLTHAVSLLDSDVCLLLLDGPTPEAVSAALDRAGIAADSPPETAELCSPAGAQPGPTEDGDR